MINCMYDKEKERTAAHSVSQSVLPRSSLDTEWLWLRPQSKPIQAEPRHLAAAPSAPWSGLLPPLPQLSTVLAKLINGAG